MNILFSLSYLTVFRSSPKKVRSTNSRKVDAVQRKTKMFSLSSLFGLCRVKAQVLSAHSPDHSTVFARIKSFIHNSINSNNNLNLGPVSDRLCSFRFSFTLFAVRISCSLSRGEPAYSATKSSVLVSVWLKHDLFINFVELATPRFAFAPGVA